MTSSDPGVRELPRRPPGATLAEGGWTRCFVADEPRLSEAVETYRELGFEVLLLPVDLAEESCSECLRAAPDRFREIYTRRPQ
jgi:hypothetical protein